MHDISADFGENLPNTEVGLPVKKPGYMMCRCIPTFSHVDFEKTSPENP